MVDPLGWTTWKEVSKSLWKKRNRGISIYTGGRKRERYVTHKGYIRYTRGCKTRDSRQEVSCDVIGNPDSFRANRLLALIRGFLFSPCQRVSQGRECNKRRFMARNTTCWTFRFRMPRLAEFLFAFRSHVAHVARVFRGAGIYKMKNREFHN